ncbi:MAG: MarR family transcriptional regulator [Gemmatimonadetes bacterium]|jgi:MarR family transcriptional regulator, 2-MHQ and catechol-resistance regulon repressor|nr:MarR family transcriptional regulator [Gemmatimonadota bacterium]MBT7859535.1 MarR family transcriptional regulator [Gemmatimonadota bacterium]
MNNKTWTYGPQADLALDTFVKLVRGHATVYRLEVAHIRTDYGLTEPQFAVIEGLGHLGAMQMGELSRKMLVTGGNMTVVVDNLERDGLVKRLPNPEDRRSLMVDLTPKGKKLFERIFPHHAENLARMFSVLDEAEQRRLGQLMKKLGTRLSKGLPVQKEGA